MDFASCQPAAEALSEKAIRAEPSEPAKADDDVPEFEKWEPADADEQDHEEHGTAGYGWHYREGKERKGGGRHGLVPKVIGALVNYYRWRAMQQSRSNADRLHQSMEKLYRSRDNIRTQVDAALHR